MRHLGPIFAEQPPVAAVAATARVGKQAFVERRQVEKM
jgi:hypothetical protein